MNASQPNSFVRVPVGYRTLNGTMHEEHSEARVPVLIHLLAGTNTRQGQRDAGGRPDDEPTPIALGQRLAEAVN